MGSIKDRNWCPRRGDSPPKQEAQVDPGDRPRLGDLLNKSALFWKPTVPFFIFGDIFLSHPLFQTVLSRLRGWKSDLQSLFFRIWSPAFVWGGCGDFRGWWGGNGHPSKITYHEENRAECEGNRSDSLYEKRNRRAVNKAHLFQINVF